MTRDGFAPCVKRQAPPGAIRRRATLDTVHFCILDMGGGLDAHSAAKPLLIIRRDCKLKKFLSLVVILILLIGIFSPVSIKAVDNYAYYTYYFQRDVSSRYSWSGNQGARFSSSFPLTFSDVFGGHSFDTDVTSISWATASMISLTGSLAGDLLPYYDGFSNSNLVIYNLRASYPIPFIRVNNPLLNIFPNSSAGGSIDTPYVSYNLSFAIGGFSSAQTIDAVYRLHGFFTLNRRIDVSSINSYLISINNTMEGVQQSLSSIQGVMQQGFTNIDTRLLAILNAINQSSSSGGGTAAIVGAVNGATAAVNQVLAQQKVSSADIVGAIGSQTSSINSSLQGQTDSLNATLNLIDTSVQNVTNELKRQADETMAAVQQGHEIMGMATQTVDEVRTKWDALLVPLDFTKQIFEVFSGGTQSAAYTDAYSDVLGYKYNTDTGGLEPIRRRYRQEVPRAVSGTIITFPSFTLNVPGVGALKLWDEYSFDLAMIKQGFPVIFDAIYLISGVLMIYWVISFLIHYFEDIIG